jgi:hypothetical protein
METINKFWNWAAHGFSLIGIVTFQDAKSVILFIGSVILILMQIRLHFLKIKNEKKNLEK